MSFDPEAMREIVDALFAPQIVRLHGQPGAERLRDVLAAVRKIYRYRSAESFGDGLTVFASLSAAVVPVGQNEGVELRAEEVGDRLQGGGTVQVLPNGRLIADEARLSDDQLMELAKESVVYVWRAEQEAFALPSGLRSILNPNGYPSALAPPTFFLLSEALDDYDLRQARHSTCYVLQGIWHDAKRLVLTNKPEHVMRRSLAQHLRTTLRDHAEIREEQNVSETEPVDVKVTWNLADHLSLIEIKWVGKSVSKDASKVSKTYWSPGRPREGADQLADYLEDNRQRAPVHETEGYLVVFDARRKGIDDAAPPGDVSDEDARSYATDEIVYDPDYSATRDDFRQPRRFWLEPKLTTA